SRQHKHLGLDARLDNVVHQTPIPGQPVRVRRIVAKVVGLIDDDEVIVAPVQRLEIDFTGVTAGPAQVRMVEYIVIESVGRQEIPAIIDRVQGPIVPEFFRAENEHAVVPQLIVLDNGESLKRLSYPDTAGQNATIVALDLVKCAQYRVALES